MGRGRWQEKKRLVGYILFLMLGWIIGKVLRNCDEIPRVRGKQKITLYDEKPKHKGTSDHSNSHFEQQDQISLAENVKKNSFGLMYRKSRNEEVG